MSNKRACPDPDPQPPRTQGSSLSSDPSTFEAYQDLNDEDRNLYMTFWNEYHGRMGHNPPHNVPLEDLRQIIRIMRASNNDTWSDSNNDEDNELDSIAEGSGKESDSTSQGNSGNNNNDNNNADLSSNTNAASLTTPPNLFNS